MRSFIFALCSASLLVVNTPSAQQGTPITVVRDPGCGCCMNWVAHLRKAGFSPTVTESPTRLQDTKGIPPAARSCHTGTVEGYVIEGHVPAEDIRRLLQTRPNIAGLAVPGMPSGSPGMEVPGGKVTPYNVMAIDKTGKMSVFSSHK
jgi:hypothetical protein